MEIREERHGDVTVLTLFGDLDARTLPAANEKLNSLFDSLRVRLVVNLETAEMVTSTGIGFLVDAARRTRQFGGDTVLSNPPRLLQRSLESLKIGDYFKTFPSDREAVAWFRDRELDETQAPALPRPVERPGWFARLFRRGGN